MSQQTDQLMDGRINEPLCERLMSQRLVRESRNINKLSMCYIYFIHYTGISTRQCRLAVAGKRELTFVCEPCTTSNVSDDTMEVAPELHEDDSVEESVDTEVHPEVTAGDSFRVDVSFQQPVVLHERSLEDDQCQRRQHQTFR
jgi:hypothetical protein